MTCSFGGRRALDGVSLEVRPGSVVGVVGINGSGKSTLVRCLGGALKAEAGTITLEGKAVTRDALLDAVGTIAQSAERQLFAKTAYDDVAFGPRNLGLSDEEVAGRVERALEAVGLGCVDARGRSPQSYSGGQKRRLAIAGILALEPCYYLFDEADAGLDPRAKSGLGRLMRRLADRGAGLMVVVSHDLDFCGQVADELVVLCQGRIVERGSSSQVLADEEVLSQAGLRAPALYRLVRKLANAGADVDGLDADFDPEAFVDRVAALYQRGR